MATVASPGAPTESARRDGGSERGGSGPSVGDPRWSSGATGARVHGPGNSGVATFALAVTGWSFVKQGVNQLLVVDVANGTTSGRQAAVLGQSDHPLSFIAKSFRTGLGGGDPTFPNELGGQGAKHCLALISGTTQLGYSALVSHGSVLIEVMKEEQAAQIRPRCGFGG